MHPGTVRPDAAKVRQLRLSKGLTQADLAKGAGYDKKTVENVEAGKPCQPATLGAIAEYLGVALNELVVWDQPPRAPGIAPRGTTPLPPGSAPPVPPLLVGRDADLRRLKDRLARAASRQDDLLQVVTAVHGWPGVGKTSVASALAHDVDLAAAFPDGVLWTSLGQAPDVLAELTAWGRALGVPDAQRPGTVPEASGRLAALLREKRMLLIVDDAWEAGHVQTFRIGGRRCAMLVTTRARSVAESLSPSPGDAYNLDILPEGEALELLQSLAPAVVGRHPAVCRELVRELEGLPLALQVAGRLLSVEASRGWDVRDLLRELREDAARLLRSKAPADMADVASQTTPTVAALLRKSTDRLEPLTRERYTYLGAFAPKPAMFGLDDMVGVWEVRQEEAKGTADELIGRGLLEPVGKGRFWMHALLVTHARSLCSE